MFLKITSHCGKDLLINADKIVIIEEPKPDEKGCTIYLSKSGGLRTKNTMAELEMLLDADSVEKRIEALKQENARLRIQQSTEAALGKAVKI